MAFVSASTQYHPKYDKRRQNAFNAYFKSERGRIELIIDSEYLLHLQQTITMKPIKIGESLMDLTTGRR